MKKRLLALGLVLVFAFTLVGLAACGEKEAERPEVPRIAFVPKVVGQAWWDYVRDEGVAAWARETGIDVIYQGPPEVSVEGQVQIITDLLAQGIDILHCAPNDPSAVEALFAEARSNGVIVITHEAEGIRNVDFNLEAFDSKGMGGFLMDELAGMMGGEGEYVTMVGSMTMQSHNDWADAAVARQKEAYPNMVLVPTARVSSESDSEVAYARTMELMQLYPNLKGILGTGSFDGPGAGRAIRDAGRTGEVFAISLGIPSELRDLLHEGVLQAGGLWNPALSAKAMLNLGMMLWNGETIQTGSDLGIPGYDNIIVNGTEIIGDGAIAITKDNVDDFTF